MSEPFGLKKPTIQVKGFNNTDANPERNYFSFDSGEAGSKPNEDTPTHFHSFWPTMILDDILCYITKLNHTETNSSTSNCTVR